MPPPLSDLMAADDVPEVFTVRLLAIVVPPPVVIIPPALFPVVVIFELEIFIVEPSPLAPFCPPFPPYANVPLAPSAVLLFSFPLMIHMIAGEV